jgi:hypothetical protein
MSGDFLGIGHKLRNTREEESRGQRFVGKHWKFEFLLRSGGRGWSFKRSRDFIFGGPLDEAKKTVWIWEQKIALNFWPVPSWHFTDLFFFSLPTRSVEDKILIQFFDARSASSCQVILFLPFLFEHQFNNLIEFSEIIFVKWFIGNLWKHEDHFWNVSLENKIIKICVAYPIYFLNPCENLKH